MPNREQIMETISKGGDNLDFRKSLEGYQYLDKEITKQCIMEQNWGLLKVWVSYNLKKKGHFNKSK